MSTDPFPLKEQCHEISDSFLSNNFPRRYLEKTRVRLVLDYTDIDDTFWMASH